MVPQQLIIDRLGRWEGPPQKMVRYNSAILLENKLGEIIPDLIVRIGEPPKVWQATILSEAVDAPGGRPFITSNWAWSVMSRRRWLNLKFSRLSRGEATAIRDDGTDFEYPAAAIMAWATELSRSGILAPARAGDGWFLWNDAIRRDREARYEASLGTWNPEAEQLQS